MININHTAIVLGLFETGLGVSRTLGREGIEVIGLDFKKDIGFYSKYINAQVCPHPIENEKAFIEFLIKLAKNYKYKPVLYITSDDFLKIVSVHLDLLQKYLLINMPEAALLNLISNKFEQNNLAKNAVINVPETSLIESQKDIDQVYNNLTFPIFVKGMEATEWRKVFGGSNKGFIYSTLDEFKNASKELLTKKIKIIAQVLIEGPDTNHFKFCGYVNKSGKLIAGFCLKKIRQNPIHFGVGCSVESIRNNELMELGKKFFKAIDYLGIGSAEFKIDERDGKFKLIELNPRYWQQNSLAPACGVNFPLIQYLDLTDQPVNDTFDFKVGVKWVNIYSDFDSFLSYKKEGALNFTGWLKSLKGKKVFSDWAVDDIKPGFYEIRFGKRLFKLPKYLLKKIIGK